MERSGTKIKLNLILFSILLILISCSPPVAPDRLRQDENITVSLPAGCWLLQPVTYRLRQSAKLEYQNNEEFFEGFMDLDLKQNQAHLVIFTALGVTLLNLEIKPHNFSFADTGSHNKREQRFAAVVADSVQKIFFSLKNYKDEKSLLKIDCRENRDATELVKISSNQSRPHWFVTYSNYKNYPGSRLPQRILLQSNRPEFKLTLWLHKAEIKKMDTQ
jgi:outer membrane biogenesis lipoprotein LolB